MACGTLNSRTSRNEGKPGNSSALRPLSLKRARLQQMVATVSLTSTSTSPSRSSRMMLCSFLAGRVTAPAFSTIQGTLVMIVSSILVVMSCSSPSATESSTLERIGMLGRVETAPVTLLSPSRSTCLARENFIRYPLLRSLYPLCRQLASQIREIYQIFYQFLFYYTTSCS